MPTTPSLTDDNQMKIYADAFKKEEPDLLICDFYTIWGQRAGDLLGIPIVIHAQLPLSFT